MRHQPDVQIIAFAEFSARGQAGFRGQTKPVHAGIQLQPDRQAPALLHTEIP